MCNSSYHIYKVNSITAEKYSIKITGVVIVQIGSINGVNSQIDFNDKVEQKVDKTDGIKKPVESIKDKPEAKAGSKDLEDAVKVANKLLFKNNTHLKFQIHEKTKEVMVKIVNDESGEVVKEIPPEKMLDMVAKLWEIAGILIDERR